MVKVTLSEIAAKVGVPVVNLSSKSIEHAIKEGVVSRKQGEKLLAELNRADGLWKNPVSDIPKADVCLWEQP